MIGDMYHSCKIEYAAHAELTHFDKKECKKAGGRETAQAAT